MLLLGLLLAGILKVFVPMSWMHKQLGGTGIKSVVKAALLGAPLPLCSCGVIPAAVGLRRAGASKAATTSFLISTPETGVDSVMVSYVLLGPFMAIVRPIAAVISAITAGFLVSRYDSEQQVPQSGCCSSKEEASVESSCCSSEEKTSVKSSCCGNEKKPSAPTSSCCGSSKEATYSKFTSLDNIDADKVDSDNHNSNLDKPHSSFAKRLGQGVHFAATELIGGISVWLLVGLFFAALVQSYLPTDFLTEWGDGILAMLVMIVISIPMYICATASTVVAAGLLFSGISPGAVLVFMLAGPATNIATLGVVSQELGKKALWGYLGGVLGVATLSGVVVNYLVTTFGFVVRSQTQMDHALLPEAVIYGSAVLLAILMAKHFLTKLPLKLSGKSCCS